MTAGIDIRARFNDADVVRLVALVACAVHPNDVAGLGDLVERCRAFAIECLVATDPDDLDRIVAEVKAAHGLR